jgi:ABC-2 type transport system ATP-binding protein
LWRRPEEVRAGIGIVFGGERGLYLRLTPRKILRYWAALYKLADEVAERRTEELPGPE